MQEETEVKKVEDDDSKKAEERDVVETKVKKFHNGWTREIEIMVEDWADQAQCFRWMHDKTSRAYFMYNQYMMIPVIVLSTLTGATNFGMDTLFSNDNQRRIASLGIGGVSIFTGIISTLANFLRYAEGSKAHSVAAISWAKFSRFLRIELALHPNDRMEAFAFLKMFRVELDRLIEQSPQIPEAIIRKFKVEFRSNTEIKRPDVAGYLEHTRAYDSRNERLKQISVEAALVLMNKKRMLKDLVMDDIDRRIRNVVRGEASGLRVPNNLSPASNTGSAKSSPLKFNPDRTRLRRPESLATITKSMIDSSVPFGSHAAEAIESQNKDSVNINVIEEESVIDEEELRSALGTPTEKK